MTEQYCPTCEGDREVAVPDCADGHAECPELACVDCGSAWMTGWLAVDIAVATPAVAA